METNFIVSGHIVDVVNERIYSGTVEIENGFIKRITEEHVNSDKFIIPGFIDAHIHIESSMLIPSEFGRLAVVHGTVATVSDPHEIANVLGISGVKFMIENGNKVPFKFFFGAPSCVPATAFETAGATLGPDEVDELLKMDAIKYLSEMMNYPGVLHKDKEVIAKVNAALKYNKPVDGHAPGLTGKDVEKYIQAGISTDHECFTIEEAIEKIKLGMIIQIREGSAAKNFETLIPLINSHPDKIMLCSDDKHPDDLVEGHMNLLIKRAIAMGYNPLKVLKACTFNPVKHYKLEVGLLQEGDPADFLVVNNLNDLHIESTYINGICVAKEGKSLIDSVTESAPNRFNASFVNTNKIAVPATGDFIRVQKALEGQLITNEIRVKAKIKDGFVVSDTDNDILKIVLMNRYLEANPVASFVNGFGFKKGAIASTVAHDSHNIIAVGTNDKEIVKAINLLIRSKGGIALVDGDRTLHLPLPVAGIMSAKDGYQVAQNYQQLNIAAKSLGTHLHAPFMTLSFMALLVIPNLKISDKGLFDGSKFEFVSLFVN